MGQCASFDRNEAAAALAAVTTVSQSAQICLTKGGFWQDDLWPLWLNIYGCQ